MEHLERRTFVTAPREAMFRFFSEPENLALITPPSLGFRIVERPDRTLQKGDRIRYTIRIAGIRVPWVSIITEWTEGLSFTDEQGKGPYRYWSHRHILEDAEGGTLMTDRVDYALPFGLPGQLAAGWLVRRMLRRIFDYRESAIARLLAPAEAATTP